MDSNAKIYPLINDDRVILADLVVAKKLDGCICLFADGDVWVLKDKKLKKLWSYLYRNLYVPRNGDIFDVRNANLEMKDIPRSKHRGVSWASSAKKWQAQVSGKFLGYYSTEEEAAAVIKSYTGS